MTELQTRHGATRTLIDVWPRGIVSRLLHVNSWEDFDAILTSRHIRGERKESPYFYWDFMGQGLCAWVQGVVVLPTSRYPVYGRDTLHQQYDDASAAMAACTLGDIIVHEEMRLQGVIKYRYPTAVVEKYDLGGLDKFTRDHTPPPPRSWLHALLTSPPERVKPYEGEIEREDVSRVAELHDIVAALANSVPQLLAVNLLQWLNGTEVTKLCDSSPS